MDTSPARGPSPHRRGNGLPSADWGALVDLDPRLSEGLLERLAAAGVAAYVEPAGGEADALSRAAPVPGRPLDRLWVDPARADDARAVVGAEVAELSSLMGEQEPGATAHGLVQPVPRASARRVLAPPPLPDPPMSAPGTPAAPSGPAATPASPAGDPAAAASSPAAQPAGGPMDPDEAWRQIVEGFDRKADSPVPPWPVEEDVDAAPRSPATGPTPPARDGGPPVEDERARRQLRRRTDPPARGSDPGLPGWVEPAKLPDEGGYVPPPPPPVPRLQPRKLLAVASILLGLVLLFRPSLLNQGATTGVGLLGLVLFAGGAGALVWWMRDAPPTDSGPDDGAVV